MKWIVPYSGISNRFDFEEAEATDITNGSDITSIVGCTGRMGAVLNDPQVVFPGYLHDRVHIHRLPAVVHHVDRLCFFIYQWLDRRRIDVQTVRVDVSEPNFTFTGQHGPGGDPECLRRGDNFIVLL